MENEKWNRAFASPRNLTDLRPCRIWQQHKVRAKERFHSLDEFPLAALRRLSFSPRFFSGCAGRMRRRRERSEIRRQKSEKTIVKTDSALWRNLQVRRKLARITPARARLPLKFWWRGFRKTLEPEASFLLQQRWEHGIAIDVGANEGLYSYVLAKLFDCVEAFEPNETASADLRDYNCPKINLHGVALSRSEGEGTLHVPILAHGLINVGYGSLERETLPPSDSVTTQIVRTKTLDSYGFENIAFIKIDVEGHELQVLEGATETIARCRPTILLETKAPARSSAFTFLKDRQFELFYLWHGKLIPVSADTTGLPHENENFFAVPSEKVDSLRPSE